MIYNRNHLRSIFSILAVIRLLATISGKSVSDYKYDKKLILSHLSSIRINFKRSGESKSVEEGSGESKGVEEGSGESKICSFDKWDKLFSNVKYYMTCCKHLEDIGKCDLNITLSDICIVYLIYVSGAPIPYALKYFRISPTVIQAMGELLFGRCKQKRYHWNTIVPHDKVASIFAREKVPRVFKDGAASIRDEVHKNQGEEIHFRIGTGMHGAKVVMPFTVALISLD